MIRHFFLDKTNTIINNTKRNMGLNPILSVSYGANIMRGLIHFDINEIKALIEDKTFANIEKLHFTLKMTNCFSVAGNVYNADFIENKHKRASSFELILFKLPCDFDAGRGFDLVNDFWFENDKNISYDGSSWYFSKTLIPWIDYNTQYDPEKDKGGIYSQEHLEAEYNKFKEGKESIIVGSQYFDFGNENLSIDITSYVLNAIKTNKNYGLCLAFAPHYENNVSEILENVNFFTDHTNTFFHPFVETIYEEYIDDNRNNFTNSLNDKLYLTVYNDGILTNLDNIPTCFINDIEVEVKQASKGVYYAINYASKDSIYEDTVCYDKWSKMSLNGENIDDVELEFFVNKKNKRINIGNTNKIEIVPSIYGINDGEDINQNEIREVIVDFKEKYSNENHFLLSKCEYRLYVKDGDREIDVIEYQPIETINSMNFINIYTMDLLPNKYYLDIKIYNGREKRTFKNVLYFNIVNNVSNRIQ